MYEVSICAATKGAAATLTNASTPDINTASAMTSLQRALASRRNEARKRDEGRQRREAGREQERRSECVTEQRTNYSVTGEETEV